MTEVKGGRSFSGSETVKNFYVIFIIVFSIFELTFADTEINGDVSGVWDLEGSPYIIFEGATVPIGETLEISPAVDVFFNFTFIINGNIYAHGSNEDSIRFRANPEIEILYLFLTNDNDIDGFREFDFGYCRFINPRDHGVSCYRSDVNISHSTALINSRLFDINDSRNLSITDCEIQRPEPQQFYSTVISAYNLTSMNISNNLFNGEYTLQMSHVGDINLSDNRFEKLLKLRLDGGRDISILRNRTLNEVDTLTLVEIRFGLEWNIWNIRNLTVRDNNLFWHLYIESGESAEITGNTFRTHQGERLPDLRFREINNQVIIADNNMGTTSMTLYRSGDEDEPSLIERNHMRSIGTSFCNSIIRDNVFEGHISVTDGIGQIDDNLCWGFFNTFRAHSTLVHNIFHERSYIQLQSEVEFINNTFYLDGGRDRTENAMEIRDGCEVLVENCIIVQPVPDRGTCFDIIEARNDNTVVVRYSLIDGFHRIAYGRRGPTEDVNLEDNNYFEPPQFVGGTPYNLNLQIFSPCIDTGNPESPRDPDSTRADMGALYFNRQINHPPVITSPVSGYASRGQQYTYIVRGVDDDDEIQLEVEDLPEWLRIIERDAVADTMILSGEVPENIEDFSFFIRCADPHGIEDTLRVSIQVISYNHLGRNLSGVLLREESPFYAPDPIYVLEGDSLFIEPGCEIIFGYPSERFRPVGNGFNVCGYLHCVGTSEDSIILRAEDVDMLRSGFDGLNIWPSPDTSEIGYTRVINPDSRHFIRLFHEEFGIGAKARIHNCLILDRISTNGCSYVKFIDNVILSSSFKAMFIAGNDITFENNYVAPKPNVTQPSYIFQIDGDSTLMKSINNVYTGFRVVLSILGENARFISRNDLFIDNTNPLGYSEDGFHVYGGAILDFDHATIVNCGNNRSCIKMSHSSSLSLRNSIISNSISEAIIGHYQPEQMELDLHNNCFWANAGNFGNLDDSYGHLTAVNANGDSVDAHGNIFLDPRYIGVGRYRARISEGSPCIDAADLEGEFDPDESPPDIGYHYFNHDNVPIRLEDERPHPPLQVPVDLPFSIGVVVVDEDGDEPALVWTLYRLVAGPDRQDTIFTGFQVEAPLAELTFDDEGLYLLKCLGSDGYSVDTLTWQIEVTPELRTKEEDALPLELTLGPVFPNPFNSRCTIRYTLPRKEEIKLVLYDMLGKKVKELVMGHRNAGIHLIELNATNLSSGVYFLRLNTGNEVRNKRLTVIK